MRRSLDILLGLLFSLLACQDKVELGRISTSATIFRSYWFESEETFYLFYHLVTTERVRSTAEVEYSFDAISWTKVEDAPLVQLHEPVDCGPNERCGSLSVQLKEAPQLVALRLRFHRDGELADTFSMAPRVIRRLPGTQDRSFYVFGIFDRSNQYIQWRGRNAFPGLEHETAERYGLRRPYEVQDFKAHAGSSQPSRENPSLYGASDPCTGTGLTANKLSSSLGADVWLPFTIAPEYAEVCGTALSHDAKGPLALSALARKNPVTSPIEQDLALRFTEATQIPLLFASCSDPDPDYLAFQKARMGISTSTPDACLDSPDYRVAVLRPLITARIAEARARSNKSLALLIVLHHRDAAAALAIDSVLAETLNLVLNSQQNPRVAATFIYDSFAAEQEPVLPDPAVIWCPTRGVELNTINSCYFTPSQVVLGPIEISTAPLLPDYLSFQELDEAQKNGIQVESLSILTPAEPANQDRLDIISGTTGFWIFHPDDILTVAADEYLSYCAQQDPTHAMAFRLLSDAEGNVSAPSNLALLPAIQNSSPSARTVQLGIFSSYPFFLTLRYRSRVALGPKNLSGILAIERKTPINEELGEILLSQSSIPFRKVLQRCTEYCIHPAFDDTQSYLLSRPWHEEFQTRCYAPSIPESSAGGLRL